MMDFFAKNPDQKCIIVPFIPTAENIAIWIFKQLDKRIEDKYKSGLKLDSIKLWETPSSNVICTRKDLSY